MMKNKVNSADKRKMAVNSEGVRILEELYYGKLNPWEANFREGSEYDLLRKKIDNKMDDFEEKLSKDEVEAFRELVSLICDQLCMEESERFIQGFRLGGRLVLEAFQLPHTGSFEMI